MGLAINFVRARKLLLLALSELSLTSFLALMSLLQYFKRAKGRLPCPTGPLSRVMVVRANNWVGVALHSSHALDNENFICENLFLSRI